MKRGRKRQPRIAAGKKAYRKATHEKPSVYLTRIHPDYWVEEERFFVDCLKARPQGMGPSEKQAHAYYAAVNAFLRKGDAALPEYLRQGGWDDLLSGLLSVHEKLSLHPRVF